MTKRPMYEPVQIFVLERCWAGEVEDKWEFRTEIARTKAMFDMTNNGCANSPEVTFGMREYWRKERVR